MPGSDGSQFISMRKYGAAFNAGVSSLKQPGPNRFILPQVSGVGLTREEFLPSISKLNRAIVSPETVLTTPPNLTYSGGPNVSFPPLPGATNYKLYNNATNALILDLDRNTNFSIPSLINPPANLAPNTSYTVYVVGSNSLGPSPRSSTITFTTPPAPPTITVSGTNLTIPSSAGALTYTLQSTPAVTPRPTITPGTTAISSLGLTPGTAYTLSLTTTGSNGIESLPGTAVTLYTPPNPVQSVTNGARTSSTAVVSWTAPSPGGVTGYNIYDGSTLYATVTDSNITFGTVFGKPALSSGTTYTNFSVKAYYNTSNNESTSIPLNFSTTVIINPPTNVQLTGQTDTTATLSWTPPATGNKDGFYITTTSPSSSVYTVPGGATTTTYTITGLTAGTTYVWNIFTYYQTVNDRSTAVVVPTAFTNPLPPTNFAAVPAVGGATVTWNAQALPNNADIIGYKIYDAPSGTIPAYTVAKTSPLSQVITGLASNSTYTYYVASYGTRNSTPVESITRASVIFTTPALSAPTNGNVFPIGSTTATMSWNALNNGETGYNIYNGTTLYASLTGVVSAISLGSGSYVPLTPATAQSFNVRAYYGSTATETPSLNITFTTFNNYPIPTNAVISSTTNTTATLTWTPVTGAYSGYFVQIGYGAITSYATVSGVSSSTYTFTGLPPGNAVRASVYTYTGSPSLTFNPSVNNPILSVPADTPIGKFTLPNPPITPSSSNVLGTTATISWVTPTTPANVNANVYRYNIYNGTTFVAFVSPGTTTYNVTSLSQNTAYTFNIRSVIDAPTGPDIESSNLAINFTTQLSLVRAIFPPASDPTNYRSLNGVSSDSTGQYVIMVDDADYGGNGAIWTSVDYGASWRRNDGNLSGISTIRWAECSVSSNGERAVIAARESSEYGAYVCMAFKTQLTTGSGNLTWVLVGSSTSGNGAQRRFTAITISANGNKIYATGNGGNEATYESTFSGSAFSELTAFGTQRRDLWATITCSADGRYVYAGPGNAGGVKNPYRYDTNAGGSWQIMDPGLDYTNTSFDCSDDGRIVYAMGNESYIRVSIDYGVSWTQIDYTVEGRQSLACSSDGSIVLAVNSDSGQVTRILNQDVATLTRSQTPVPVFDPLRANTNGCHISCSTDGSRIVMVTGNSKVFKNV
jgi:hypothetical protein